MILLAGDRVEARLCQLARRFLGSSIQQHCLPDPDTRVLEHLGLLCVVGEAGQHKPLPAHILPFEPFEHERREHLARHIPDLAHRVREQLPSRCRVFSRRGLEQSGGGDGDGAVPLLEPVRELLLARGRATQKEDTRGTARRARAHRGGDRRRDLGGDGVVAPRAVDSDERLCKRRPHWSGRIPVTQQPLQHTLLRVLHPVDKPGQHLRVDGRGLVPVVHHVAHRVDPTAHEAALGLGLVQCNLNHPRGENARGEHCVRFGGGRGEAFQDPAPRAALWGSQLLHYHPLGQLARDVLARVLQSLCGETSLGARCGRLQPQVVRGNVDEGVRRCDAFALECGVRRRRAEDYHPRYRSLSERPNQVSNRVIRLVDEQVLEQALEQLEDAVMLRIGGLRLECREAVLWHPVSPAGREPATAGSAERSTA
mmetsp:Transcript_31406/g.101539  ORF Transcript_31406/g.101539 Transcript_31406/m.101539 type:complete len:425 (-) Transcript_31406:4-1278(-)|eukprot:scaffold4116_cov106-Isochrysis_galbana.AAC.4